MALLAYMHIFIAFWSGIPRRYVGKPLPFVFNMDGIISRVLAAILFYWLAPLILFLFALKAQPYFPGNTSLFSLAAGTTAVMLWLQIRSRPVKTRTGPGYAGLWIGLAVFAAITINLGIPLTINSTAYVARKAPDVGKQLVVAMGFDEDKPTQVADNRPNRPSSKSVPSGRPAINNNFIRQYQQSALSRGLDLAGSDLKLAKLKGKDFSNADLQGAILSGQKLFGTPYAPISFRGANMENAKLVNMDFAYTNFIDVNLRGANFRGTTFKLVQFNRADLRGANFIETEFDSSDLFILNADLRGVKGLDCESLLRQDVKWKTVHRDQSLACGKPLPKPPAAR